MHRRRQLLALVGALALVGCGHQGPPRYDYIDTPTPVPTSVPTATPGPPVMPRPHPSTPGAVMGVWGDVEVHYNMTHTIIQADDFVMDLPGQWRPRVGVDEKTLEGSVYHVTLEQPDTGMVVVVQSYKDGPEADVGMEVIAKNTEDAGNGPVERLPNQRTRFAPTPGLRAVIDGRVTEMRMWNTWRDLVTLNVSTPESSTAILDIDEIMNTFVKRYVY